MEITKLFIRHGADPNIEVATDVNFRTHESRGRWGRQRKIKLPTPLKDILEADFRPADVAQINKVLEEKNRFSVWKLIGWE